MYRAILLFVCASLLSIIGHYLTFFAPNLIMGFGFGGERVSLRSIVWMNLVGDTLFDAPLLIWAGLCMMKRDDCAPRGALAELES